MPKPSQKTPQKIARMLALHREGASAREIGDELGLSHPTIKTWLADVGLTPNGGQGPREKRKRHVSSATEEVITNAAAAVAELGMVTGSSPPRDRRDAYAHAKSRLQQIGVLVDQLARGVPTGESHAPTLAACARLEADLLERLAALAPPEHTDPEDDPHNVKAVTEVRSKLAALIEHAESSFRCAHCGRSPYPEQKPNGHVPAPGMQGGRP